MSKRLICLDCDTTAAGRLDGIHKSPWVGYIPRIFARSECLAAGLQGCGIHAEGFCFCFGNAVVDITFFTFGEASPCRYKILITRFLPEFDVHRLASK